MAISNTFVIYRQFDTKSSLKEIQLEIARSFIAEGKKDTNVHKASKIPNTYLKISPKTKMWKDKRKICSFCKKKTSYQ